jgi:hypothetical protein
VIYTLLIPRSLSSQNRAANNLSPTASHGYRKERQKWADDIVNASRVAGVPLVGIDRMVRRRVVITRLWGKGQREWDKPNAWGGAKMVIDVLCPPRVFKRRKVKGGPVVTHLRPGASLIYDDSTKWADIEVRQEKAVDGVAATRIEIEECV